MPALTALLVGMLKQPGLFQTQLLWSLLASDGAATGWRCLGKKKEQGAGAGDSF